MPNAPSDWVAFQDYLGLNGEQQQQLEADALQRAQSSEGDAMMALRNAQRQAAQTGTPLESVVSYGEYTAARQRAQGAWGQVGKAAQGDWRAQSVAQTLGHGGAEDVNQQYDAGARLGGAEQRAQQTASQAWGQTQQGARDWQATQAGWNTKGYGPPPRDARNEWDKSHGVGKYSPANAGTRGNSGASAMSDEELIARAKARGDYRQGGK